MATETGIEWTDVTWNPVVGCTPVSPGCLNCYAATMALRLEAMGRPEYAGTSEKRSGRAVFTGVVRCLPDRLTEPLRWRKPRRVFVNSMSDLFNEAVPFEFVAQVYSIAVWAGWHKYQILTKRPDRSHEFFAWLRRTSGGDCISYLIDLGCRVLCEKIRTACASRNANSPRWPLANVWLGTSVENQEQADARIPHLLRCPAKVRFLSVEPMLGPVNLNSVKAEMADTLDVLHGERIDGGTGCVCDCFDPIDWVIVGGESGHHARPCDVDWIRSIVSQCRAANVPCFVKQVGAKPVFNGAKDKAAPIRDPKGGNPEEWPADLRVREFPKGGAR